MVQIAPKVPGGRLHPITVPVGFNRTVAIVEIHARGGAPVVKIGQILADCDFVHAHVERLREGDLVLRPFVAVAAQFRRRAAHHERPGGESHHAHHHTAAAVQVHFIAVVHAEVPLEDGEIVQVHIAIGVEIRLRPRRPGRAAEVGLENDEIVKIDVAVVVGVAGVRSRDGHLLGA